MVINHSTASFRLFEDNPCVTQDYRLAGIQPGEFGFLLGVCLRAQQKIRSLRSQLTVVLLTSIKGIIPT